MNKSSSILSQSSRNVSSFFNESCESVAKCCQFRQKYQDCYRDMSQARIQSRNLKQENISLRGTLRGTEEENAVLKNILASKKEIIGKLNREAIASNQEISRLEDELHMLTKKLQQQTDDKREIQEHKAKIAEEYQGLLSQHGRLVMDNQKITGDYQRLRQEQDRIKDQYSKEVQKIAKEKEQAVTQTHQFFFKKLEQLGNTFNSPTKASKNSHSLYIKENKTPLEVTLKDLDMSLATFKQRHQQQQNKYEQVINIKDTQIQTLKRKVTQLEAQMAQSMQLFEQQITQTQQLKQTISQHQQNIEVNEANRNRQSQRQQLLLSVGKRIASMLRNCLIDSADLVDRLVNALPSGKKFELEVLLKEAQACCEVACRNTLRNTIGSKQYEQTSRAIEQLRQDYELLQLKHATLQRQYTQILDDNQRLIKYNHLSRYRMIRNSQPLQESTPNLSSKRRQREDSSNKENMRSTINQ